ncbi:MAG: hypothetical protein KatS3mg102_1655 [Planctomycetota bacterium]|nr:MAG: hypothetical protein KatS3mg102_1655 [Planctomycetota bacterium]
MSSAAADRPRAADYLAVGCLAAALLGFEVVLLRVFAFSQWHHFASLSVSLALLGFGAAGTALVLLGGRACRAADGLWCAGVLLAGTGVLALPRLNAVLPVRPLFAVWDLGELRKLLLLDFAAAVPFFGGGLALALVFVRWPAASRPLYAADLAGAGAGSLLALALLARLGVEACLEAMGAALLAVAAVFGLGRRRGSCRRAPRLGAAAAALLAALGAARAAGLPGAQLHVSDFKPLAMLLELPDAQVLHRAPGLRHLATEIRSQSIRMAPGLSLMWQEAVPAQDALVLDAERVLPLPRAPDRSALGFLRASLGFAPYALRPRASVCVLGTGGWLGAFGPLVAGARRAVWVEDDPQVRAAFARRGLDASFAAAIDDAPRRFVETARERFDLVVFERLYPGGDALTEEPLLTVEALARALALLEPGGLLILPVRLHNPPRRLPRVLATAAHALARAGAARPAAHVLVLRSLRDAVVLCGRDPLQPADRERLLAFARRWGFEPVWLAGEPVGEQLLVRAAAAALAGRPLPEPAQLYRTTPPTDARPYAWASMRWQRLPELLRRLGRQGLAWLDWGPLLLVVALVVAAGLAAVLIVLPLGRLGRGAAPLSRPRVLGYFTALGLGYLLLEMAALQRATLLCGHPVVAAAVVFATFLVGSGLGSLSAPRARSPGAARALLVPAAGGLGVAAAVLWGATPLMWRLGPLGRGAVLVVALLPLAFALGRWLPWGLRRLAEAEPLIPWAWAINGFASVIAPPLAALLAVEAGQPASWLAGLGCYLAAAAIARSWQVRAGAGGPPPVP